VTDRTTARRIVEALADGLDPGAREALPSNSPIDYSRVVRALQRAMAVIDRQARKCARRSALPSNAGKSWCDEDDRELAELFDSGRPVADIASCFERTPVAIAARLVRLGKAPDFQSAFVNNLRSPHNGPSGPKARP